MSRWGPLGFNATLRKMEMVSAILRLSDGRSIVENHPRRFGVEGCNWICYGLVWQEQAA